MFYMIAVEAVAKLAVGYDREGASRKHVLLFFTRFFPGDERTQMHRALKWAVPRPPDSPGDLGDYLYGVRCDVVHEGRYCEMAVPDEACIGAVRRVLLEGVLAAVRDVAEQGVRPITPAEDEVVSRRRRRLDGPTR